MAEEEFVSYKDISELRKEVDGIRGKKDISTKELYDAVQKLAQTMEGMLEVFGAAAEQMQIEEKGYGSEAKKHEMILSKLDKIIDQNKTIAEGMVAVVEMVKERIVAPAKEREESFRPRAEPRPFMKPTEWQPKPEFAQRAPPMMAQPIAQPQMAPQPMPASDFGMQMPSMQPPPSPDTDFPDFGLDDEEPKKKGLFGMFKK